MSFMLAIWPSISPELFPLETGRSFAPIEVSRTHSFFSSEDLIAFQPAWNLCSASKDRFNQTFRSLNNSKPVIYVVDDDPMLCEMIELILQSDGFQTVSFTDPVRALHAALEANEPPDLLLTDYVMAPMNGLELIAGMKSHLPKLKTILFSGRVRDFAEGDISIRPDRILTKPFVPRDFLAVIQGLLKEALPAKMDSL